MEIAILYDYFDEIGGAEITLLHIAKRLGATIFTTNINKIAINKLGFNGVKIKSIGNVPRIRHVKQLLTQVRFNFLKLGNYDFFIFGGSFSIYASKNYKPNLWYCFSPLRGLYDLRYDQMSKYNLLQIIKEIQIIFDKKAVKNMQKIIAPSLNVKKRIKNYYNRESELIYHPIETSGFLYKKSKNYWLSVNRIDPYKRIELQLEAFKKLKNEKLIIIGGSSKENQNYLEKLKRYKIKNVIFMGPVYDSRKIKELYAQCKGFLATSKNEDFGMTPVEAMASGKPVIAPNEGGYKETVINGKTGMLINNIDGYRLAEAIQKMSVELEKNPEKYKKACLKQAKKFDVKVFIKKFKEKIRK